MEKEELQTSEVVSDVEFKLVLVRKGMSDCDSKHWLINLSTILFFLNQILNQKWYLVKMAISSNKSTFLTNPVYSDKFCI